jgi:hypothetical protein
MLRLRLKPLRGPLSGPLGCQHTPFLRPFALSRFPERAAPSGGRTRQRTPTLRIRPSPREREHDLDSHLTLAQDRDESSSGTNNSPLWEESQRPPTSNPEDGLKRLLQNNVLVVTRSVNPGHCVPPNPNDSTRYRQLEMLNIFIGFEQTNKYVICWYHILDSFLCLADD